MPSPKQPFQRKSGFIPIVLGWRENAPSLCGDDGYAVVSYTGAMRGWSMLREDTFQILAAKIWACVNYSFSKACNLAKFGHIFKETAKGSSLIQRPPPAKFQVPTRKQEGARVVQRESLQNVFNMNKTYFSPASSLQWLNRFVWNFPKASVCSRHPAWETSAQMVKGWQSY